VNCADKNCFWQRSHCEGINEVAVIKSCKGCRIGQF
jgi:hypothetical protein